MFTRVLVVVLCSLCVFTTQYANAQSKKGGDATQADYVCDPDCPETPFDPINQTATATFNFGGCVWEVHYWYRFTDNCSTGEYCDIQIRQIRSVSSPPCTTLTAAQIFTAAAFQALKHAVQNGLSNEPKCVPQFPNCVTNWRVEAGSCWRKTFEIIDPSWPPEEPSYPLLIVGPCAVEEACCYFSYTICEDQYGQIVVTQTGGGSSSTQCQEGCTKICGQ
jgi:hypothetical protein